MENLLKSIFFLFWNWIGAIILFIFHEMHNSHTYQIHINQLVEIQILNIQYIWRKIRQRNLIKLQFLIWIQNLKKMCAMCLPGVCRLCISFVKSVFLNEIGKKPYWHSHTIGRYRLESKTIGKIHFFSLLTFDFSLNLCLLQQRHIQKNIFGTWHVVHIEYSNFSTCVTQTSKMHFKKWDSKTYGKKEEYAQFLFVSRKKSGFECFW